MKMKSIPLLLSLAFLYSSTLAFAETYALQCKKDSNHCAQMLLTWYLTDHLKPLKQKLEGRILVKQVPIEGFLGTSGIYSNEDLLNTVNDKTTEFSFSGDSVDAKGTWYLEGSAQVVFSGSRIANTDSVQTIATLDSSTVKITAGN